MLAALILSVALLAAPASAGDVPTPADAVFPRGLPAAPDEGSCFAYRCVWDARHQGNDDGQSVILTAWQGGYVARPISHQRAHRLQDAYCDRRGVTCEGYDD